MNHSRNIFALDNSQQGRGLFYEISKRSSCTGSYRVYINCDRNHAEQRKITRIMIFDHHRPRVACFCFNRKKKMTTNFPPDQTVVLKGLKRTMLQADVEKFVREATPYVQSIHLSIDKYPPKDTHSKLAYLNYQVLALTLLIRVLQ